MRIEESLHIKPKIYKDRIIFSTCIMKDKVCKPGE